MELLQVLTFCLAFTCASFQNLEIIPITTNDGYMIIRTSQQPIIDNYTKILHIVNLTKYTDTLETLYQNFHLLNLNPKETNYQMLNRELSNLQHNLNSLIPDLYNNKRERRGLVNVIGKAMKFITGTMDNEDSEEIYKHLENLDTNSKQLIDQVNKQVIINDNLIKTLTDMANSVNEQQTKIRSYLSRLENETSKIIMMSTQSKFILEMYADIMTVNRQVEKLKDIVLLSRLDVLAHDIFSQNEIEIYNVSAEKMPFIKNSVIFKNDLLILVVLIPNFASEKYFNALIIPSPNGQNEELSINLQSVIIKNNEIFENNENPVLKKNLKQHSNKCLRNLLRNKNNKCEYKINENEIIISITEDMIITKNLPEITLKQNCIQREIIIKGNNLIKFNNCNLEINDLQFTNYLREFKESMIIPSLNVNLTKIVENITLTNIHFKTIQNREKIEYIEMKAKTLSYNTIILIILTCSIIMSIITLIILFYVKNNRTTTRLNELDLINYPVRINNQLSATIEELNNDPFRM